MKLVTYRHSGRTWVGQLDARDRSVRALTLPDGEPVTDLVVFLKTGAGLGALGSASAAVPLAEVTLLAPIPRPARNVFCIGKNYAAHKTELEKVGFEPAQRSHAEGFPEAPIVFTKAPETVIATGDPVHYPTGVSEAVDYEAELAVVIGKGGRGIPKDLALDHVLGYTIVNDVTARDWQKRHQQWFLGKSFDTFCPMGPCIVTADEIDGKNLDIRLWVNDELRQSANTRDLVFDVPTLIATISAGITLHPGDIISTGTPDGVGIGFDPPKLLKRGDRMRIEIEGIGTLENQVI